MNKDLNIIKNIDRIKIEDFIWYIYFFIIGFNLYSNYLEKKYILENDIVARNKFRMINCAVLFVSLIIYFYFMSSTYSSLKNTDYVNTEAKKQLQSIAFVASILFVIGGLLTLYVAFNINTFDEEIAVI